MKCTNMWAFSEQLRRHAIKELKAALEAHGGSYSWCFRNDDGEEECGEYAPLVLCNHRYAGPVDVRVRSIWMTTDGIVKMNAETNEYSNEIDVNIYSDVVPYHIPFITEAIPETSEVQDVTVDGMPLT